jgi:hypothetical protein
VDLSRYVGTWYEIARLPMWFQRHCVDSKAIYSSRSDGAIGVHNECVTDTGKVEQAEGVATVIDAKTNARLTVVFDNWFARLFGSSREGNYWVLDLDPEFVPDPSAGGTYLSASGRAGPGVALFGVEPHSSPAFRLFVTDHSIHLSSTSSLFALENTPCP